jgi:hypothetical protein
MAKAFYIKKQSGTYSEAIEAFGLANLLDEIFVRNKIKGVQITLKDLEHSYLVETNKELTEDLINNLTYFQIIKFIKKDAAQEIPTGINYYFDYPQQKAIQDEYKELYKQVEKIKSEEEKKKERKRITEEKLSEFGKKIDAEFDIFREIKGNPYASFSKLFENFHLNQDNFKELVASVLKYYEIGELIKLNIKLADEKPTAQQLYNPNQGKGLNKGKANNVSMGNLSSHWIAETMKISGALSFMVCQYVKVGSGYDLKIYVPEFNEITFRDAKELTKEFKKYLKSVSPVKLDIVNSLSFTTQFIKRTPEFTGKPRKTIKGFHSVYQKDLGQNKAVANIAFVATPDFVTYSTKEEGYGWIEILEHQKALISNIEEQGDAMKGLLTYRNFLGAVGNASLNYFNDFSFWYATYLMQKLTKGNRFVRTFKIEDLNKFYNYMASNDLKLTEIIQNEGFLAVAQAIRKSTVSLQYTPKDQRKFEIRYGLAQQLQNKSKSKEDLTAFIGEFVGIYNAETARNAEKNGGKAFRANVKDSELLQFYSLLDKNSPRLIGALLASYGFALNKKEAPQNEIEEEDNTSEEN